MILGMRTQKKYLSAEFRVGIFLNVASQLTLSTGAASSTGGTGSAATWAGGESARLNGGRHGIVGYYRRRSGNMGGTRRQADGGLDVRSEVLEGLGDGADARAARHAGHADCDAAGGWHVASLLFVEEIVSLALALLLLRRDSGGDILDGSEKATLE